MKSKFRYMIFLLPHLLPLPVLGGTPKTVTYSLVGAGVLECTDWTKIRETALVERATPTLPFESIIAERWILGYVNGYTAAALAEADPLRGVNGTLVLDWLDKYCASNKEKDVTDGAQKLLSELVALRVQQKKRLKPKSSASSAVEKPNLKPKIP